MLATLPIQAAAQPFAWLCFDVETAAGRPESIEREFRISWAPDKRWEDETVGRRWREAFAKKTEKSALLDVAPIVVIGMRSDLETRCLHWCYEHPLTLVSGAGVEGFASEAAMLTAFRGLVEQRTAPQTTLVGHNLSFDEKRIRYACLRNGLRPPAPLLTREQPRYDTMTEYCHRYSVNDGKNKIMVSLSEVLEDFGIDSHKDLVDGAMIPELHASGQYDLIIKYCLLDVLAESDLFLRMTGASPALR